MPPLHAVSWLAIHLPCPHYMQFWSLRDMCHAPIICSSGMDDAHIMPSLHAISELLGHMPCPQLLLCIAMNFFILLCITSYYIVF
jgi:hypothetical protein